MIQPYNEIVRQQKVSSLAILAALGSFTIGVMLPWNLRLNRQAKVASMPQQRTQENIVNTTVEPGSLAVDDLEADSPVPSVNIGIPKVKLAIDQRIQSTAVALTQLEDKRFNVSVPQRFQGTTIKEVNLPPDQKLIALTFDDGPWPKTTEQILDILQENNIKATFFWLGAALKNNKEIAQRVANEGHAIANHTWNHRYHKVSSSEAAKEIGDTANLIEEITGIQTSLFRPPGGVMNNGLVDYVYSQNYANIMWSVDSADWRSGSDAISRNILNQAKSGGIVLMHDGGGNRAPTVKALPGVINELNKQGYKFVTVPELLEIADKHMTDAEIASQEQKAIEMSENEKMPMYQSPLP